MNTEARIIHENGFSVLIIKGAGKIKVISISKIKKITAIKKNRIERGRRAELFLSNPHSNGEGFSRFDVSFLKSAKFKIIKIQGSTKAIRIDRIIISSLDLDFLIGS